MAKILRTSRADPSVITELIKQEAKTSEPLIAKTFVARQKIGPKPHNDLVIKGTSGVDVHRQWFNYYGLNEQTYRYKLTVVRVPEGHELEKQAIECQSPRNPEALSWEDQAKQASDDLETMLSPGD